MSRQVSDAPGPLRSGIVHTAASLTLFSLLSLGAVLAINTWGDDTSASPVRQLALFETEVPADRPVIKSRFAIEDEAPGPSYAMLDAEPWSQTTAPADADFDLSGDEPDLGVSYGDNPTKIVRVDASAEAAEAVRINGVRVTPGQSWQATRTGLALPRAPIDDVSENTPFGLLPAIAKDGRTPAGLYARPFANPEGRPTVSITLGGLGINYAHTKAAIDELPPEITLSFAPSTRDLQGWIDRARAAGHEVLLEVPMEPYDFGRERPHADTLYSGAAKDTLVSRLSSLMGRATGYYGVTNYQGGKFAADAGSVAAVADALAARGLAFIEDGSLGRSGFQAEAARTGLRYAVANTPVDTQPDGDEILARLLELETVATERGAALGSGFAYPVTIDILKDWTGTLDSKGVVLAPASTAARALPKPKETSETAQNDRAAGGQVPLQPINTSG